MEIRNQIGCCSFLTFAWQSFNPCFGGNQKSNHIMNFCIFLNSQFQSLFWWKSEIKSILAPLKLSINRCFNPCFGGNQKSNKISSKPTSCRLRKFQSLFWWKSEIKLVQARNGAGRRIICFNPCFGGNQKSNPM